MVTDRACSANGTQIKIVTDYLTLQRVYRGGQKVHWINFRLDALSIHVTLDLDGILWPFGS